MRKTVDIVLIFGFLFLDWLRFHDVLKPGERMTAADILTGALSLLVFYICADSLARNSVSQKTA